MSTALGGGQHDQQGTADDKRQDQCAGDQYPRSRSDRRGQDLGPIRLGPMEIGLHGIDDGLLPGQGLRVVELRLGLVDALPSDLHPAGDPDRQGNGENEQGHWTEW